MPRQCYRNCYAGLIAAFTMLPVHAGAAPVIEGVVAETGLRYWEWNSQGVLFRLTQRLPDQTRAFFLARGFDAESAELVATQCVFQSMFRNTGSKGSGAVDIDLDDWVVEANDERSRLLTRGKWEAILESSGLQPAAMIAFTWSLLPTRQSYQPDDYNWGMTSYGLAPGMKFNLGFTWRHNGQLREGMLRGVECPPDIHPEPGSVQ